MAAGNVNPRRPIVLLSWNLSLAMLRGGRKECLRLLTGDSFDLEALKLSNHSLLNVVVDF